MTAANATSYRKRFRYAKELRRYSQTAKWNTVSLPRAVRILDVTPQAGGIQKILIDGGLAYNANDTPQVEWSLDGSTGWTNVGLNGYTAGAKLVTTLAVAAGAKYFRVKAKNTFGLGPASNVKGPITVLA